MIHKEILEDLAKDCPCNGKKKWCFIREMIMHTGFSDRQAEQVRLFYDYKFMESKKEDKDIGDKRAFEEFIAQYGKKFAEVYQDGMKHEELFVKIFGIRPMPTDEDIRAGFCD